MDIDAIIMLKYYNIKFEDKKEVKHLGSSLFAKDIGALMKYLEKLKVTHPEPRMTRGHFPGRFKAIIPNCPEAEGN